MPSPFPGMNPYLEQPDTWEDFHHNFMTRVQEMLVPHNLSKGGGDRGHGHNKKSLVQKTPGVCGGRACIRRTRITDWGLVNCRRLGLPDEQIPRNIVGLTPEDIHAAWDYYREYPAEIDEVIRENESD